MKTTLSVLVAAVGLSVNVLAAGANVTVVPTPLSTMQSWLARGLFNPQNTLYLQSDLQFENLPASFAAREFPQSLQMKTLTTDEINADQGVQLIRATAAFRIPVQSENLKDNRFWNFSHLNQLLPKYHFDSTAELSSGTDGRIQIPAGFTFGLAPSKLDCAVEVRTLQGSELESFAQKVLSQQPIAPVWSHPVLAMIQVSSDCNMFFREVEQINFMYRLNDGTVTVLSLNQMFVKNIALEKLHKVRFLAGDPLHIITTRLQDQLVNFTNAFQALGSASRQPSSVDEIKNVTEEDAYNYRQQGLQYHDPIGDRALQIRVNRAEVGIFRSLTKQGASSHRRPPQYDETGTAEASNEMQRLHDEDEELIKEVDAMDLTPYQKNSLRAALKNSHMQIEGRENPFLVDGFRDLFEQIIWEESQNGITPSLGEPHVWSDEIRKEDGSHITMRFSKILTVLALGVSSRFMATGHEKELHDFLASQDHQRVTFDQLFRKSYQLEQGDIYLTILNIENVLSANWTAPHRDSIPFINNLKPIQSAYNNGGNYFGDYYHFIGTMLYGYVYGKTKSGIVGTIEAIGSRILHAFAFNAQENHANATGGKVGQALRDIVTKRTYLTHHIGEEAYDESHYLNHNEDFRDRLALPVDPDLKMNIYSQSALLTDAGIFHRTRDLIDCNLTIFPMRGKNGLFKFAMNHVTIRRGKMFALTIDGGSQFHKFRGIISQCSNTTDELGFESRH